MIEAEWVVFLIIAIPFGIWAAWSDLKYLRIPNSLSLMLVGVFIVVGIFVMPLDEYLMRLGVAILAFFIGFAVYYTGVVGGGDIKLIVAMLPYIPSDDLIIFAFLAAIMSLAGVLSHIIFKAIGQAPAGWKSWDAGKKYPFGFSLAGTFIFFFVFKIAVAIAQSGTAT